jgi:hypothetical protein
VNWFILLVGRQYIGVPYTLEKVSDFPVPSRDVTKLFLQCGISSNVGQPKEKIRKIYKYFSIIDGANFIRIDFNAA